MRMDRILLSSFWITSFRFELTRKRSAEKRGRKKKYLSVNQKRGLEQERVKNIERFRRSFLFRRCVSKWNFPSANPFSFLFPDPIPKYPYRKCIAIGFKTSQLSIDIQHLGNRSSMKSPFSLSPRKRGKYRGRRSLHIHGSQSAIRAFFFFCLTRKSGELRGPNNRRQIEVRERERERWIIRWENINEGRPFVYKVEPNPIFFTGWASKFERVARWREIFFLVLGHFGKRSPRERIREREWSFFREWN